MANPERELARAEDIALRRIPIAYHEAGHAIMAYWVGCDLADAGVIIDPAQTLFRAHLYVEGLPVKERVMVAMAGHLSAYHWIVSEKGERTAREWHEIGGPAPLTKAEFLETYLAACRDVQSGAYEASTKKDDWKVAALMVGGELDTAYNSRSFDRFKARCHRYQNEALKQIRVPLVWRSICKIADVLLIRDKLTDSECKAALVDDFDLLKAGYQRQGDNNG